MSGALDVLLGTASSRALAGTVTAAANIPSTGFVGYNNGFNGGSVGGSISNSNFGGFTVTEIACGASPETIIKMSGATVPPQNFFTKAVINGQTFLSSGATYSTIGATGAQWSFASPQAFSTAGTYNFSIS